MCGIFGLVVSKNAKYSEKFLNDSWNQLAILSESRGKDSSGLCAFNQDEKRIDVLKGPERVTKLIDGVEAKSIMSSAFKYRKSSCYAFGHARLVTNGSQLNNVNNQPVAKDGIVAVHNGIVANAEELWHDNPDIVRTFEIDTEIMLALLRKYLKKMSLKSAISRMMNSVSGTASNAFVMDDLDKFCLATNNGSLYYIRSCDAVFFASEYNMLKEFERKLDLSELGEYSLKQLAPNTGLSIDLDSFEKDLFSFSDRADYSIDNKIKGSPILVSAIKSNKPQKSIVLDLTQIHLGPESKKEMDLLDYPIEKIKSLKRCSSCILPETFPHITFDSSGVCNYCHNYKKKPKKDSIDELLKLVEPYRKFNGEPDVLIPFSGGRDSTYVLHVVKKELGLNPITFTYDWGMVTDLARRNIARTCGELGVENIIVAADVHWKRGNIRRNIEAWLKNPELGMIPLFMAGDKFFFYYAHKVKKQLGIDLEIWGVNDLENTNFKTGFAGLKPEFDKKRIYSISAYNQFKLFGFVGANLIKSPGYLNRSIVDSLGSFASRYATPKSNYFHLFDYIEWDEKHIEKTLFDNYDWESSVDTKSTWRIGDGTASFYNYIYTRVVGFSENDTFRSNQIREGMISRDKALALVYAENEPRYNSLKWYLEILGLNFQDVIKKINTIPTQF